MHATLTFIALLCCSQAPDDVTDLLKSKAYSVTWNNPDIPDPQMTLEIGTGNGHGGTLHWLRFRPEQIHVEVLAISYDERGEQYRSKWPPDRVPRESARAYHKDAYSTLLTKIGWLKAAKLEPKKSKSSSFSSADFWVSVYGVWKTVPILDYDWAGYDGSGEEPHFAVPRAIAGLAAKSVKSANAKEYEFTAADRAWASARFNRDWPKFEKSKTHWWVKYRYLSLIGVLGNEDVFPTLRKQLNAFDPQKSETARTTYYTINAATRLIKTDVRTKPVEEMDLRENAAKVLELLQAK